MSKHRRAARVDDNQKDIVKALRQFPGITVALTHDDIFVGYKGKNFWFEVKNPDVVSPITGEPRPSAIKKSQKDIRRTWCGQYDIVWKIDQILEILGIF